MTSGILASPRSAHSAAIQRDYNNRDFVETVQLNILQIAEFLNEFERATRTKLATVNEKMSKVTLSAKHKPSLPLVYFPKTRVPSFQTAGKDD